MLIRLSQSVISAIYRFHPPYNIQVLLPFSRPSKIPSICEPKPILCRELHNSFSVQIFRTAINSLVDVRAFLFSHANSLPNACAVPFAQHKRILHLFLRHALHWSLCDDCVNTMTVGMSRLNISAPRRSTTIAKKIFATVRTLYTNAMNIKLGKVQTNNNNNNKQKGHSFFLFAPRLFIGLGYMVALAEIYRRRC